MSVFPISPPFNPLGADNYRQTDTLFIKGSPDITAETTLYIGPKNVGSGEIPLLMAGHPASDMTLTIGRDDFGSGEIPLYTDGTEGFGGASYADNTTLYVGGIPNNGSPFVSNPAPPLYIDGPDNVPFNSNTTLHVSGTPIVVNDASGTMPLFASGAGATPSNPITEENFATLYIKNFDEGNDNIPLHIETDFNLGVTTSLYVNSTIASGVATLEIEGRFLYNSGIPLLVKTPTTNNITLFNRGYRS